MGFPGASDSKESACNVGNLGLIPGLGRSPGEGKGYPLQYSGPENFTDRGIWQAIAHGVAKSRAQLRDFHFQWLEWWPQKMFAPEHVNKTVSGKRDAFKDVEVRSSWVWEALNPISGFLIRHKRRETQTQGTSHMKMKAETGGTGHKPRDPCSPRNWKKQEGPHPGPPGGLHHLDPRRLACRTRGG